MEKIKDNSYQDDKQINHRGHNVTSRFFMALLFIAAGSLLIADRTGNISHALFLKLFNWQMLLIGIGLVSVSKKGNSIGGLVMILIGIVFLVPLYFNIPMNTRQLLWPAVLIGIGIIMLFKGTSRWERGFKLRFNQSDISDIDMVEGSHIFGGGDHYVTSENFKGGRINAIFGGGKYNLTRCKLAPGTNILELSLVFGGIELLVPSDWKVKVEMDSILGGFSNKGAGFTGKEDSEGVLIIRGSAIFGGGELKRV